MPTRTEEHSRRGFTLIELLVTIALLAIIATLAAPNLASFLENRRLIGAAEAVLAEIQWSRSEAIKQSMDMYVLVDLDPNRAERWVVAVAGRRTDGLDHAETCDAWGDGGTPCQVELDADQVERRVVGEAFRGIDLEVVDPGGAVGADRGIRFDFVRGLARRVDEGAGLPGWQYRIRTANAGRELQVQVNVLGRAWICEPGAAGRYAAC